MSNFKYMKKIIRFRQWPAMSGSRSMSLKVEPKATNASIPSRYDEVMDNEPIKYFGSKAAVWRAKDSRSGGADEHLWYQPYVISASLSIFLIYFCILREESDIDLKLAGNLYEHVNGLEELQLTTTYKYNKQNGLSNKAVIKRLNELGIDVNLLDAKISEGSY